MIKLQKLLAEKGNTVAVLEGRFIQQQEVQETPAITFREHLYSKDKKYRLTQDMYCFSEYLVDVIAQQIYRNKNIVSLLMLKNKVILNTGSLLVRFPLQAAYN